MKKRAAGGVGVVLSTSALLLGTVAAVPASAASTSGRTLIIDNSFVLVTADPGHVYEQTGNLIDNAMYDTLVTYGGTVSRRVVPQLATSYQTLNGGRKYVFHLNPTAKFSDGTPVTSADVAWSLTRMINLKGNPAFLLAGETITTDGPETVVMTSSMPNPGLPYILADPACGILNMKVVEAHGGTDAANAVHEGHGRKLAQRQLGWVGAVHHEVVQHDVSGGPGRQPQLLGPSAGLLDRRVPQYRNRSHRAPRRAARDQRDRHRPRPEPDGRDDQRPGP